MTTEEVLDAIARERARLMKAIDALGPHASIVPVTEEGWTAKNVLAHLIHWATQIAFGLGAQIEPPVYVLEERRRRSQAGLSDRMPSGDEWNALAVASYRDVPLDQVRSEFEGSVEALSAQARLRTDDEMSDTDAIPWAPNRPLWHFIAGDTFLHWPLHAEAIERAATREA
ncbi:MAG: maleylpyruvate isomerase N-terminal domain-containing protein [Dehalococcoidia bacterium]